VIAVIAELAGGELNRATWEALVAAQQLAALTGGVPVRVLVPGNRAVAETLAGSGAGEVLLVDSPALEAYTPDAYTAALADVIQSLDARFVMLAHTYQARDYVPALAARLDRPLIADVTRIAAGADGVTFSRPMFQGKLSADVRPTGGSPCFVTVQIGAFRADQLQKAAAAAVTARPVAIEAGTVRQVPEPPFREAQRAVDLSQAARIVAVGRGIKSKDQLPVAESLARALGAELAASRPICDSGWLPMERQIGSSGQTVAPKLYVAVGISGAIQHLVGMKGSRTIVAINKDADAPIFEVADYGLQGDLFELAPAIIAELAKA